LKDNRSFARVFRGPTWIQVGFGEPPLQRTRSDGQAFKSVDTNQERRIDISSVFLFSWIPDLLLALGHNAFARSNSNRSPDL
jgi:hypothetical protein